MGLTLNYELRLPATKTEHHVRAHLEALRAVAATLPFRRVSPVVRVTDDPPADAPDDAPDGHDRWRHAIRFFASVIAKPFDEDDPPLTGDVESALGFAVNPGDGCDTALFGFMRRADAAGVHREWFWYSFCKTQYASAVSDEHFVTCHTSLVRLLDAAIELGIDVVVRDEGRYWETRSESQLRAAVHHMNRLVARFAGTLSDALGDQHQIEAPIFQHPRFERLEMGE